MPKNGIRLPMIHQSSRAKDALLFQRATKRNNTATQAMTPTAMLKRITWAPCRYSAMTLKSFVIA